MDSLRQLFQEILSRAPGYKEHWVERQLCALWAEAVGETIAKHTRAYRFRDALLSVEVDHPIWKAELFRRKHDLIESLRKRNVLQGYELKDIHFTDARSGSGLKAGGRSSRAGTGKG